MVTKVTTKGKPQIQIAMPGAEAEYIALLNALTLAVGRVDDSEARLTLSSLLIAMLPTEEDVNIPGLKAV